MDLILSSLQIASKPIARKITKDSPLMPTRFPPSDQPSEVVKLVPDKA